MKLKVIKALLKRRHTYSHQARVKKRKAKEWAKEKHDYHRGSLLPGEKMLGNVIREGYKGDARRLTKKAGNIHKGLERRGVTPLKRSELRDPGNFRSIRVHKPKPNKQGYRKRKWSEKQDWSPN